MEKPNRKEKYELFHDYIKIRNYFLSNNKLLGNFAGNILFDGENWIRFNDYCKNYLINIQKKFYNGISTDEEKEEFLDSLGFVRIYTYKNDNGKYELKFDLSYEGFDGYDEYRVEGVVSGLGIVNSRLGLFDGYENISYNVPKEYAEDSSSSKIVVDGNYAEVYNPLFVGVDLGTEESDYAPITNDIFEISGYSREISLDLHY